MAQIICFERRAQKRERVAPVEGGAQILFFLGVRYERMEDSYSSPLRGGDEPRQGETVGGGKKRKRRARG